ncbi:MAG: hypothetical protein RL199_769 [Pseudomonadota bacterium]|jgi:hypothetical protein
MALGTKQKSLYTLVAMLVLALGAGAWAWFGVFKAEEAEKQRQETEAKAFTVEKAAIRRLTVRAKGEETTVERDGEGWKVVSPLAAKADKFVIDTIVDRLLEMKSKATVADDDARLAEFGLTAPSIALAAVYKDAQGADQSIGVKLGGEPPLDSSGLYYMRDGDPHVYLGESFVKFAFEKGLFELRDKSLVNWEDKDVQSVTVAKDGSSWTAERSGDGWKLTAPEADEADRTVVESIVTRLRNVRATAFAAEAGAAGDLSPFGLAAPAITATVVVGADKQTRTVQVGVVEEAGAKKAFARLADGSSGVLAVHDSLLSDLTKSLDDLREKVVAPFVHENVRAVDVVPLKGEKLAITRTKELSKSGPFEVDVFTVNGKQTKLLKWKLQSMLTTLASLKGLALVDGQASDLAKYGLDQPRVRYVAKDGEGKAVAEILIGAEHDDKVYAMRGGTKRVWDVSKATVDELPTKMDDVVESKKKDEPKADETKKDAPAPAAAAP